MNSLVLHEVKTQLETDNLIVRESGDGLWIAATLRDSDEISVSDDASVLMFRNDKWVAIFPSKGLQTYEVTGEDVSNLLTLIKKVYNHYNASKCQFNVAFQEAVPSHETYLVSSQKVKTCQ